MANTFPSASSGYETAPPRSRLQRFSRGGRSVPPVTRPVWAASTRYDVDWSAAGGAGGTEVVEVVEVLEVVGPGRTVVDVVELVVVGGSGARPRSTTIS